MNLRQKQILEAVVKEYIDTAQPVSSKVLCKKYKLGVSSATIRAEMKRLEQQGYLYQPHTSAGRIPAEKGYRFFIGQPSKDMFEKYFNDLFKQIGKRETKVFIDKQIPMVKMKKFTLIITNYKISNNKQETIGLISPTKMRYDYNISLINKLREILKDYEQA